MMGMQTAFQSSVYEQTVISIMRRLPPERVLQLVDFAQFLELQAAKGTDEGLDESDTDSLSLQEDFMLLSIAERRHLMAEQAKQMVAHYERTASERQAWQAGDFIEY